MRGKTYKKIPPATGSNVARWVEVPDESATPKPKRKKKEKAKPKRESPEDLTPAPPADRFR